MTTIKVALDILSAKESTMRNFSSEYHLALDQNFNAGPIDTAYDALNGKWKKSQEQITKAVVNIADVIKAIREAFEDAETQLVATLGADGASAPSGGGGAS